MRSGSVVIPTLHEEEVIGDIVEKLADLNLEVIVVDADSNDKTKIKAHDAGATVYNLEKENDLSKSVIHGIEKTSNSKIVVMDGDGQHPVDKVPEMLSSLEHNSLIYGYREKIEGDWPAHRRLISYVAEGLSKLFFQQCRFVEDPLTGFFGLNKRDFENKKLKPRGYKIFIEFLVHSEGKVEGIGYQFRSRKGGDSSIGIRDFIDFKIHLLDLKYREMTSKI